MSLHQLANQMQSAGRGDDKVLVHMTPGEVQGLQSLAMKHGGSLTINPKTGLPEAGFLSSLLPTILGLGLAPFTGGLSAAMLVGGGYTLATGSLKKGLMAGLGAYGGAGLGSSLSSLGAGAAGAGASAVTPIAGAAAPTMAPTLGGSVMGGAAGTTSAALNPATLGSGFMNTAPNVLANPTAFITQATPQLTAANTALQIPTAAAAPTYANMGQGLSKLNSLDALKTFGKDNMMNIGMAAAPMLMPEQFKPPKQDQGMIRPYTMERTQNYPQGPQAPVYGQPFDSSERMFFNDQYTAGTPYAAPGPEYKATGGLTALAMGGSVGGPVEDMSAQNSMSQNTGYPMANLHTSMYANPQMQRPVAGNVVSASGDAPVDPYTGEARFAGGGAAGLASYGGDQKAIRGNQNVHAQNIASGSSDKLKSTMQAAKYGDFAAYKALQDAGYDMHDPSQFAEGGGVGTSYGSDLGGYSDGGQLLRGPGDGVSDDIPAQIGDKQPARLADNEFVIPARIVSELGNGSTEAGARQLYKMMDRVQAARKKSIGKGNVAVDTKAHKYLPA